MQLREHPLMKYHGIDNWPPVWTWRGRDRTRNLRGEVGIVRDVFLSSVEPIKRLFLIVEHQGNEYIGCVLFDDPAFCAQIYRLLAAHCGESVRRLGDLEVEHLL